MTTHLVSRRRALQIALGMVASALKSAQGQAPSKVPVVGVLLVPPLYFAAFEETLRQLGYTRGKNVMIETSNVERQYFPHHLTTQAEQQYASKVPDAAADLVRMNVDVIVTGPNPFIDAARQATKSIPIVMAYGADPVGRGYISSLAKPGGNITGLVWETSPEIFGKLIELLAEVSPRLSTIAGVVDPTTSYRPYWDEAESAAKRHGAALRYIEVQTDADIPKALKAVTRMKADAITIFGGPKLWILRTRLADIARRARLPSVFPYREGPEEGGLMSYGPNLTAAWRQVAGYVDKILRGANPAQLPVEQPTQFELVVNLKTAKLLNLTVPESILLRADEVIK